MVNASSSPACVLIADDHVLTRLKLCALVADLPRVQVSGCGIGQGALLREFVHSRPRCLIIDISENLWATIALIHEIRRLDPQCVIIALADNPDPLFRQTATGSDIDRVFDKTGEYERAVATVELIGAAQ